MTSRDARKRVLDRSLRGQGGRTAGVAGVLVGGALVLTSASALAVPTTSVTNPLAPPSDCNNCHAFANQADLFAEPPYAPQTGWTPTMMANAAKDPVFWAAVALAAQDDPGGETEDCIRCHSPNAFLEGRAGAIAIEELAEEDLAGVSCEFCHRMTDEGELGNAQYALDDDLVGLTVTRHGPWDYTDGVPQPIPGQEGHATEGDPFTGSSEHCGTCHEVTTHRERVDETGAGMGMDFNEQRTYSEWANSAFGQKGADFQTCQECHMPEIPDSAGCGPYTDVHQHPLGNRRHDLLGANRFMMQMLAEDAAPGFEAATYDLAIAQLDAFILTAATLEVTAPDAVDVSEGLSGLEVTVTNDTGHKLPSGYSEGRVMWLEIVGRYGDDVLFSSGRWDQEAGTIEDDAQVRRYEAIAENYATGTRNHLLQNDYWVSDTRIPPRGLVPDIETDPIGDRYALDGGVWPNQDVVSYGFDPVAGLEDATPEDASDDQLELSIRLLYLINTPDYIQQLADDNTSTEVGTELAGRFDAVGGATPIVLGEQELSIPLSGFGAAGTGSTTTGTPPATSSTTDVDPSSPTAPAETTAPADDSSGDATDDAGADDDGGGGGCGCTSAPSPQAGWGLSLLLLGLLRRRRSRTH